MNARQFLGKQIKSGSSFGSWNTFIRHIRCLTNKKARLSNDQQISLMLQLEHNFREMDQLNILLGKVLKLATFINTCE